jgi:LysM repeat protein
MRSIIFGLGSVAVATTLGLASCGSGGSATTPTPVVTIGATNFVTLAPTPSSNAPPTADPAALQPEQTYTIVQGDYPIGVAKMFNVNFNDLVTLNNWTIEGNLIPEFQIGAVIKIPAGGTLPGVTIAPTPPAGDQPVTVTSQSAAAPAVTAAPKAPTTTVSNCPVGEYTIVAGDYPGAVATKFDTTVGALNIANQNTKGYSSFYAGLVIKIPAKKC